MPLRQSARLLAAAGALVLAAPVLSSCGFNYATDRQYTPAAGENDRDARVDVLGAVVVSGQPDSGTFIATFANNDQTESASVDSIAGTGEDASLKFEEFDPIEIAPGGHVNLAADGGIGVTGTFEAGNFLEVTLTLGDGQTVEMKVPAVTNCGDFADLDTTSKPDPAAPDQCETASAEPAEH